MAALAYPCSGHKNLVDLHLGTVASHSKVTDELTTLTDNSSFSLHPEIFQKLNLQLQNNLKELCDRYACYVKCTVESVQQSGVDPNQFRVFLQSLAIFNRNGELVTISTLTNY